MKQKGFTLIELLAVVVIIAIVATIGSYTIMKIIDTSRKKALSGVALSVRRAAATYLESNEVLPETNAFSLDITPASEGNPAGQHAYLMELSKDPWGKDYQKITANVQRTDDKYLINVYLKVGNSEEYELLPNTEEVSKIIFEIKNINLPNSVTIGEWVNVNFAISKTYENFNVTCSLLNTQNDIFTTGVNCGTMTETSTGYTIPLAITKSGNYRLRLTYSATNQDDQNAASEVINITSDTNVVMNTINFNVEKNQSIAIPFKITGQIPIAKVEYGSLIINNPVLNTNYNFNKTYTTAGALTGIIKVTDIYANVIEKNFNVQVNSVPVFSSYSVMTNSWEEDGVSFSVQRANFNVTGLQSGRSLTATVKRWGGGSSWIDVITNSPILPNTAYDVRSGDVLGQAISFPSYSASAGGCWSCYANYRIRIIITDGVNTITKPDVFSDGTVAIELRNTEIE